MKQYRERFMIQLRRKMRSEQMKKAREKISQFLQTKPKIDQGINTANQNGANETLPGQPCLLGSPQNTSNHQNGQITENDDFANLVDFLTKKLSNAAKMGDPASTKLEIARNLANFQIQVTQTIESISDKKTISKLIDQLEELTKYSKDNLSTSEGLESQILDLLETLTQEGDFGYILVDEHYSFIMKLLRLTTDANALAKIKILQNLASNDEIRHFLVSDGHLGFVGYHSFALEMPFLEADSGNGSKGGVMMEEAGVTSSKPSELEVEFVRLTNMLANSEESGKYQINQQKSSKSQKIQFFQFSRFFNFLMIF